MTTQLSLPFDQATIYGLRARGKAEYRYIGSTINPARRFAYYRGEQEKHNPGLTHWITAISPANLETDTIELVPAGDRFKAEYFWIEQFRAQGDRLFNHQQMSDLERELRQLLEVAPTYPQLELTPAPLKWIAETYLKQIAAFQADLCASREHVDPEIARQVNALPSWPSRYPGNPIPGAVIQTALDYLDQHGWSQYGVAQ
jgi:hypothetical protein